MYSTAGGDTTCGNWTKSGDDGSAIVGQNLGAALTIEEVGFPGAGGVEFHIANIVEKIKALPANAVVAVVSHSNTVGPILEGLGSGPVATIKETEFDKLFVLFISAGGSPALVTMRYGSPT